ATPACRFMNIRIDMAWRSSLGQATWLHIPFIQFARCRNQGESRLHPPLDRIKKFLARSPALWDFSEVRGGMSGSMQPNMQTQPQKNKAATNVAAWFEKWRRRESNPRPERPW